MAKSDMKELFTKRFWDDVKGTFHEAFEDPPPTKAGDTGASSTPDSIGLEAAAYTQIAVNIPHFKHLLQVKERELLSEIAQLEEEARGPGEAEVRDSTDDATSSQFTSESLEEETVASRILIQVQGALKRIEDGTYDKCVTCGKQIPLARMEAVPWAAYCAEDQEKLDRAAQAETGGSTL
jgi:RNA polymerase-binding transcription factor DksA